MVILYKKITMDVRSKKIRTIVANPEQLDQYAFIIKKSALVPLEKTGAGAKYIENY